ncbi:acyl-CoA thioesterase [Acuticoccus sp.]|uniref:acyl-CoA thioesterase n=1 Tax=Acuticoccus sp. TaxID=1904378 RepID=UPI003B52BA5E
MPSPSMATRPSPSTGARDAPPSRPPRRASASLVGSASWAPTIALSWFWGLGFFYSVHLAASEGWLGFTLFALPNALGLALFGAALARLGPKEDLEGALRRAAARHAPILIAYQALAVGLTTFAFATLFAVPMVGAFALPAVLIVAFAAMAAGHAGLGALRRLHLVALPLALGAAIAAFVMRPMGGDGATVRAGADLSLVIPTLVGFLLGPWLDVQQWQRAAAIRANGTSVGLAYGLGGALFLVLITVNAAFVIDLPMGEAALATNWAGAADATPAFAAALRDADALVIALATVWAVTAMFTTLDSAWAGVRWTMASVRAHGGAALSLLPRSLVETPFWAFLAAAAIAFGAVAANASLLDLMAPYATVFVGFAASVVLQLLRGAGPAEGTLCALLGAASLLVFGVGYYGGLPLMTAFAPLLPFLALLAREGSAHRRSGVDEPAPPAAAAQASSVVIGDAGSAEMIPARGHFDGVWFNLVVMPTYDDTNSVGNVYFANYLRWLGRAREMFFAKVLPKFDLNTTEFLILTRDVFHQFVSEMREFEPAVVRLRIDKVNRKFARIEHEIRADDGRLIGKGNQQLMFVDSRQYRLIDIPGEVIAGFVPFATTVEDKRPA